jgi:predicted  nucleic acid-binding Zn-ribbon protein
MTVCERRAQTVGATTSLVANYTPARQRQRTSAAKGARGRDCYSRRFAATKSWSPAQGFYNALTGESRPRSSRYHGAASLPLDPVWWQCAICGHVWRAAVSSRTSTGTGCPVCGLKRRARTQSQVPAERSLAVRYPAVAAQLHPSRNPDIDPAQLGARSSRKLWWQCPTCGHEWQTTVATRTDGCGCPTCATAARPGARPQRARGLRGHGQTTPGS